MRYLTYGNALGNQSPQKNSFRQGVLVRLQLENTLANSKTLANTFLQETQGRNLCPHHHRILGKWQEIRATYSNNHPVNKLRPKFPRGPKRLIRQKLKNGTQRGTETWQRATTKLRDD